MRKKSAEEVLELLMRHLIVGIEELFDYKNIEGEEFQYGERVAYTECLECLQQWTNAEPARIRFRYRKEISVMNQERNKPYLSQARINMAYFFLMAHIIFCDKSNFF